jgi:putative acetyltransferase
MTDGIAVVPYRPELAITFSELNREWIERFFTLEDADREVLQDPEAAIIAPGGQIFFAVEGNDVVGTVAVIRLPHATCELAKMAVRPSHQGRGIGERLGRAAVEFARDQGAATIFLETNSRLANAIRLYERLGFVHAAPPTPSDYARADVYMEIAFPPGVLTLHRGAGAG